MSIADSQKAPNKDTNHVHELESSLWYIGLYLASSVLEKKILPQISPEERKKKLADLETAYDRLEKKFITHQLNNSWMMRSGLVMKIYMILGKITG